MQTYTISFHIMNFTSESWVEDRLQVISIFSDEIVKNAMLNQPIYVPLCSNERTLRIINHTKNYKS